MSPKRKRTDSTSLAPLNTVIRNEPPSVPDSPRSKVAEHLRSLDLRQKPTSPTVTPPRAKRRVAWQDQDTNSTEGPIYASTMTPPKEHEMLEIGETPGAYETSSSQYPSSPPQSPNPIRPLSFTFKPVQPETARPRIDSQRKKAPTAPTPVTSAPPPTPITSPGSETVPPLDAATQSLSLPTLPFRPLSPAPNKSKSPSSSFTSVLSSSTSSSSSSPQPWALDLTWQDHEITGHTISANEPDDDGEGINGIGFRPTPAITARRSEVRRKQVSEWRAREAREARQRRIEKRRVCSGGKSGARRESGERREKSEVRWKEEVGEEAMKRCVRFAEAG